MKKLWESDALNGFSDAFMLKIRLNCKKVNAWTFGSNYL